MKNVRVLSTDVVIVCGMRGVGKSTFAKALFKGFNSGIVFDPLHEHGILGTRIHSLSALRNCKSQKIVYQPASSDIETEFDAVCAIVLARRNVMFMVDEVHLVARYTLTPNFGRVCRTGRHYGVGLLAVTQRIADVSKSLCALAQHWIVYRTTLPNDRKYLEQFIPGIEKAATLPAFHYLYWNHHELTQCLPVR